jgi:uncharacterized protein YutE (UPF0331/DUF86 family)
MNTRLVRRPSKNLKLSPRICTLSLKVLAISGQDFVDELKQMYGLRDQIAHKYGVGDFKFSVVWEVFTTRLDNALEQVQKLIAAEPE